MEKEIIEKQEHIKNRVLEIYEELKQRFTEQKTENNIDNITYYEQLQAVSTNRERVNGGITLDKTYIVRIINAQEKVLYEIYNDNMLIATMDENGMIEFTEEYKQLFLEIENGQLLLNEMNELEKQPISLKEVEEEKEQEGKDEKNKIEFTSEKIEQMKKEKEDVSLENEETSLEDEEAEKKLAEELDVPIHNIMIIRKESQLLIDYPQLKEEGTFFYRGNDGKMHAEYLDKDGKRQSSKYIETSKTVMMPASVNLGKDGKEIKKDVPYQVMETKGLTKGRIQDVRFEVRAQIGQPLELGVAQRGVGQSEFTASDINIKGMEPPTYEVKEATRSDMKGGTDQPAQINKAYNFVSKTGLGADGVELNELKPQEIIQKFIDEGYNRDEAIDILNLTIGEEQLTEEQAKEVVNQRIKEQNQKQTQVQENDIDEDDPYNRLMSRLNRGERTLNDNNN